MPRFSKGRTKPKKHNAKQTKATVEEDDRFLDLSKNPMFREQKRKERKVVIDERFKQMLSDQKFQERDFRVDKRGRPIKKKGDNFLANVYELNEEKETSEEDEEIFENDIDDESEEERGSSNEKEESIDEEKESEDEPEEMPPIQLDLARGEGPNVSSSSSEDEQEEDDGDEAVPNKAKNEEDGIWEVGDNQVRRVQWASRRLAVCNMDWGKMSAEDLMLVLHSFKPSTGTIHSVSVYLSDFGAERLEEEKKNGPKLKLKPSANEDDLEERTKQAIRAYELDRLRYFYAVCECDAEQTATAIYEACDGVEYETSGMRFDLRFIPEETEFEEKRLRDRITAEELNPTRYKTKKVKAHPLICSNPKLSWEDADPERRHKMKQAFEQGAKLDEFESLIASGSEDDDEDQQRSRYEALIAAAREAADGGKRSGLLGQEDEAGNEEKPEDEIDETKSFQEEVRDEVEESESDDEDEDKPKGKKPTKFQQYLERKKKIKAERKSKEKEQKRERKRRKMDSDWESSTAKSAKLDEEVIEKDERFSAFFKDSAFAIDRTHAQYKGGDLARRQVYTKVKRREKQGQQTEDVAARFEAKTKVVEPANTAPESTDALVERLKKKQKRRQKD